MFSKARAPAKPRALSPSRVISLAAVITVFVFHFLYGALRVEAAFAMAVAEALLLAAMLPFLTERDARRIATPKVVIAAFLTTIVLALWSAAPLGFVGADPAWRMVGASPSASLDPSATVVEVLQLLGFSCLFIVGTFCASSSQRLAFTVQAAIAVGSLFAIWAIIDYGVSMRPASRLAAHFLSPNTAGTLFGVLLCLAGSALVDGVRRAMRGGLRWSAVTVLGAGCLVIAGALIATASRGAILATLVAMICLGLARAWNQRILKSLPALAAAAAGVCLVLLLVALSGRFMDRMFELDSGFNGRDLLFKAHWRAFLEAPLRGYGLGAFDIVNRRLLEPGNFAALWSIRAAHNVYLQWLEEAGLFGALAMFLCLGVVILRAGRAAIKHRAGGVIWGLLAADLVFLLHGLSDFALQTPSMAAFFALLLGLQAGWANRAIGAKSPEKSRRTAWRAAYASLAGGVIVFSGMAVTALNGGGEVSLGGFPLMKLAAGFDRAADMALDRSVGPIGLNRVARESRMALSLSPYDTTAWLRLAYIDQLHKDLGPEGVRALRRSYQVVPTDPVVAVWRLSFMLSHWSRLPDDLKQRARHEFYAVDTSYAHRVRLRAAISNVPDPEGRVTAAFWAAKLSERHP